MQYAIHLPWAGPVWLPVPALLIVWGVLEGLAVPLPGPIILGGLAAALRPATPELALLAAYASLGYGSGALLSYGLGRMARGHAGARRVLARLGLGEARLVALDQWFARHGQWAVAWSRPVWIGNFVSLPAGMARMPVLRFAALTLAGIYPTAFLFLWAGDELADLAAAYGAAVVWASLGLGAIGLLGWRLWRRRKAVPGHRPRP